MKDISVAGYLVISSSLQPAPGTGPAQALRARIGASVGASVWICSHDSLLFDLVWGEGRPLSQDARHTEDSTVETEVHQVFTF